MVSVDGRYVSMVWKSILLAGVEAPSRYSKCHCFILEPGVLFSVSTENTALQLTKR